MSSHQYEMVQVKAPNSSTFDLSHDHKTTFNMGQLIPTLVMECLPGDYISWRHENLLRFMPLVAPVMHKVNAATFYFFVPLRLLWDQFTVWITDGQNPLTEAPWCYMPELEAGEIGDYLGLPLGYVINPPLRPQIKISPMQIAAYYLIYDEHFRDQNLETEIFMPLVAGNNAAYATAYASQPLIRAWMRDYFTSCLPFAQKGDAVTLPLISGSAPVTLNMDAITASNYNRLINADTGDYDVPNELLASLSSDLVASSTLSGVVLDPNGTLEVDINSEAVTINTLRMAFRLQEWLEKNARGGTRYIEAMLMHFGRKSSDERNFRPQFIGSDRQSMVISEVLSTAQTDNSEDVTTSVVGEMAGRGISVKGSSRFRYSVEEHGFLFGIINVQPITAYSQGIPKQYSRLDRLDYVWPTFAHLGEQAVKIKELYLPSEAPEEAFDPEFDFGYQSRYAEMRDLQSRFSGEMRTTLEYWHFGRLFTNEPRLDSEFIRANPRKDAFAVTAIEEDELIAHIIFDIKCNRKLPKYGTPMI